MKNEIVQINESEYKAILLQAVAVIEDARQSVAMHVEATKSPTLGMECSQPGNIIVPPWD